MKRFVFIQDLRKTAPAALGCLAVLLYCLRQPALPGRFCVSPIILCCAFLSTLLPLHAAEISITPVIVQLARNLERSIVGVSNLGKTPVTMQAEAVAWARVDGVDHDEPNNLLMINPVIFVVAPGQTQIVRLGMRRGVMDYAHEKTYRLVLREVPTADNGEENLIRAENNLRVLMVFRIPVYIRPDQVLRDERWHAAYDDHGDIVANIYNAGNVHYRVGNIAVYAGPKPLGDPVANVKVDAVVLPGERHRFTFKPQQSLLGKQALLEVSTDAGPHYVSLDIGRQ